VRELYPVGSLFKVEAKLTNRRGGKPFLYTDYRGTYEKVSPVEAVQFIRRGGGWR
jgi:hypothetical protein